MRVQLKQVPREALIILDSATALLSKAVLAAFCAAGLNYAIIPGGLTMLTEVFFFALAA